MWYLAPLAILVAACALAAEPTVSPSIEADAAYLLTTTDFMDSQFGMSITDIQDASDRLVIRTTGAEFTFTPADNTLVVRQLLARPRPLARVTFPPRALHGLHLERQGTGAVLFRNFDGSLRFRLNADSLLMLQADRRLSLRCDLAITPASVRACHGDRLCLDEWGCLGTYFATGEGSATDRVAGRTWDSSLDRRQVWWLAAGPPRPYPWEQSFTERVGWHWSMQNGYPADAEIEQWSKHANILLQQSEVMLWKDWSLRFIPRNGLEEFQRVNRACERNGMRNIVYTSPYYFLTGTGLEPRAMNSFDNFAVTGFSPGDDRGLNWPIFLSEIRKVMKEYQPDGLYFDGIYGNVVRTYLISRKAREVVGDKGLLEFHATGSPPGGGVYLPQIDTYFTFILRGEGNEAAYADADYLRYFVSTYNISNSIGVLCNNNPYPLDERFVGTLLDNNIRLHYLLDPPGTPRFESMQRYYWPALKPDLKQRVEAGAEARQAEFVKARADYDRLVSSRMPSLPAVWQEDFRDPALSLKLPAPAPEQGLEATLPGGWRAYLSPHSEAALTAGDGRLQIDARANSIAMLERNLPAEVTAVQCRVRAEGDCGASWGPGLLLWIGDTRHRLGLRSDGCAQTDRAGDQTLYVNYPLGRWYWLRLRLEGPYVLSETSRDGAAWTVLRADRLPNPTAARRLVIGKVPYDGSRTEYPDPASLGTCQFAEVKAFAQPDR